MLDKPRSPGPTPGTIQRSVPAASHADPFAGFLLRRMSALRLGVKDLAVACGVTPRTAVSWRSADGTRRLPSRSRIPALARLLKIHDGAIALMIDRAKNQRQRAKHAQQYANRGRV